MSRKPLTRVQFEVDAYTIYTGSCLKDTFYPHIHHITLILVFILIINL